MYPRLEMLLPQLLLFWDYKGAPPRSEKSYLVYNEKKIMTVPMAGKTFPEPEKSGWCPQANKSGAPTGRRPVFPQIPCTKQYSVSGIIPGLETERTVCFPCPHRVFSLMG